MKKLFVFVLCFAAILILSKVSTAQHSDPADIPQHLSVNHAAHHAAPVSATPQVSPFGYPPYPTVGANPAYGVPYSYPRPQRRLGSRLTPPPYQPYPLPPLGTAPNQAPNTMPNTMLGQTPPLQGTIGYTPAAPQPPAQPNVYYRPTPIRNFMTLISAPRPYIGYDPYAAYPPHPGYVPLQ